MQPHNESGTQPCNESGMRQRKENGKKLIGLQQNGEEPSEKEF
jgi:hypothetical protein